MGVCRCVVKGRLIGVEVRNMFVYDAVEAGVEQSDCEPLANAIINGFYNPLRDSVLSSLLTIYEVEIQTFEPETGWARLGATPFNWTGGVGNEIHSTMIAIQVLGRTLARRVRGLKYVPGIAEAAVQNNALMPGLAGVLGQIALFYISDLTINSKTFRPGVINKDNQFVPFTSGITSSIVTALNRRKA